MTDAPEAAWKEWNTQPGRGYMDDGFVHDAFLTGYRSAYLAAAAEIDQLAGRVWRTHPKTRAYHIALKHAAELLTAHADGREPKNLPE